MALWHRTSEQSALAADNAQLRAHLTALRADFSKVADGYDRLIHGLRVSGATVVIFDEHGREVFSNIASLVADQQGDSVALGHLIARATDRVTDTQPVVEHHDLIGPPSRAVEIRVGRIRGRGADIGTIAVVDDVTEAGRLDRLRRELVVNVGHELRTPVGALGVLAETLLSEIEHPESDAETVRRLAGRMETETARLAEFVNDVLELASARDVLPGAVRLDDVIGQAVGRVATAAELAGIEIAVDAVDPEVSVPGERSKLVSALFNLVDNAVKYSDRGSVVRVSVRTSASDSWVEVTDHGMGIAPRDRARVFDRYFRVDRARTRATGGSGLGLAIVHDIVTAHHGEVTLQSVEGQGSTFTIRLPLMAPPDAIGVVPESSEP